MNEISQSCCTRTLPRINGVIYRVGDQLLGHLGGHLPSHDLAGVDIGDERRIRPAGASATVGEICHPKPIRCRRHETPLHPVRGPHRCRICDSGAHPAPLARATPTHFPHHPFHHAPRNINTIGAQHDPCLTCPQHLEQRAAVPQLPDRVNDLRISPISFGRATTGPMRVIRRWGDGDAVLAEHGAHRLDTPFETISAHPVSLVGADELHDYDEGRSSSAAKKAEAAFKIAFARLSSAFSRRSLRRTSDS